MNSTHIPTTTDMSMDNETIEIVAAAVRSHLGRDTALVAPRCWQPEGSYKFTYAMAYNEMQDFSRAHSVHTVVMPDDRDAFLIEGRYDMDIFRAMDDFCHRIAREEHID